MTAAAGEHHGPNRFLRGAGVLGGRRARRCRRAKQDQQTDNEGTDKTAVDVQERVPLVRWRANFKTLISVFDAAARRKLAFGRESG